MYFDLFLPFPIAEVEQNKKKKDKGKNKAQSTGGISALEQLKRSCWDGLRAEEKDAFARDVALAGHLGYSVIGCTVVAEPSTSATQSPFSHGVPYPDVDPRHPSSSSTSTGMNPLQHQSASSSKQMAGPIMVQVSRYHMRLDDSKTNCLTNANTGLLKDYDILSVQPTSDKALQLACTDLANPGPNQISIITLPLHEKPYHFRLNRKQIKTAQRNGVMFEILYSPGLFPSPKTPPEVARRYRQNFMSNAREVIRITGGKGLILSSGCPLGEIGVRGPLDVVNLGTMLGMPANLAKDAVSLNPKKVLLNAPRRTFKAIFSAPKLVPPPMALEEATAETVGTKRATPDDSASKKKAKVKA